MRQLAWCCTSCAATRSPPCLQERVKQAPCPTQVAAALDFLAGVGISEPVDLGALVSTFPEALGLRVELMQENVQVGLGGGALWGVAAEVQAGHSGWLYFSMRRSARLRELRRDALGPKVFSGDRKLLLLLLLLGHPPKCAARLLLWAGLVRRC